MEHIYENNLNDDRLWKLLHACFDERPKIISEARHLTRFFIEYKLIEHSADQNDQYQAELSENEEFRNAFGGLGLFSEEFSQSEITSFVYCLVNEFIDRPTERQDLAYILKQAGSIKGVQEKIAEFVQEEWMFDEHATDLALDIIWDIKIILQIEAVLTEIVQSASEDSLRDHSSQLLRLLEA